jgi:transcriptional regulator GlxA family with amidase domain
LPKIFSFISSHRHVLGARLTGMTQIHSTGFLIWPCTRALTLALVEEALAQARRLQPGADCTPHYLHAEPMPDSGLLPGEFWEGRLHGLQRLFLLADQPQVQVAPALAAALRQLARNGTQLVALSAGVYPLAQVGLLDGYRAAVHWRWHDDFNERYPKVIATSHLFDWDRDRLSASGGLAVLDLLLAMLAREHGAELAGMVSEELVVERIREGSERQRIPLQNRLGASHPKLTQAVQLMEANIEEPLTTDEIARHVCVSRRQLERIFKQYLNRVPSQYYLELRLNKARQLLMQTSKSIIQIGLSCGFSSGPHFSSAYRNFFGVTPREDRNQHRGGNAFDSPASMAERG